MFIIHTSVDHSDVDASTAYAQIPRALRIDRGVARFDSRRLNIAVEHHGTIVFDHHNIGEACKCWGKSSINLAKKHSVHRFNDVIDSQVERL